MSENIEKVLQREEKVELLVKKTAKMNSIADEIRTNVLLMLVRPEKSRNKLSGQSTSGSA